MANKKSGKSNKIAVYIVSAMVLLLVSVVVFKTDLLRSTAPTARGLSGLVSVRGTVSLEQLKLSSQEVAAINRAVAEHKGTFTKIDLHLDAAGSADTITETTEMTWALAMETSGDCQVKSWSRKVKRGDLVGQMVAYMHKAAREYEEFTRFPDVNQNFQTLYI